MNTVQADCHRCEKLVPFTRLFECSNCCRYFCDTCVANVDVCHCSCLHRPVSQRDGVFDGYAVALRIPSSTTSVIDDYRRTIADNVKAKTPFNPDHVPHITLATGIAKHNIKSAIALVATMLPFTITLSNVTILHATDYDVLAKKVSAIQLFALNKKLDCYGTPSVYPYLPHITISFLRNNMSNPCVATDSKLSWESAFQATSILLFNASGKVVDEKTVRILGGDICP